MRRLNKKEIEWLTSFLESHKIWVAGEKEDTKMCNSILSKLDVSQETKELLKEINKELDKKFSWSNPTGKISTDFYNEEKIKFEKLKEDNQEAMKICREILDANSGKEGEKKE